MFFGEEFSSPKTGVLAIKPKQHVRLFCGPGPDILCRLKSYLPILALLIGLLPASSAEWAQFVWTEEGNAGPVNIYWSPPKLRVEVPDKQFALITDSKTDDYLGIELRDARYWQFNWATLQTSLKKRSKAASILKSPYADDTPPPPPPRPPVYDWKKTSSLKSIGDWPCQLWETQDSNGRRIALWSTHDSGAPPRELWAAYATAQSRLRLVAVRSVGPDLPPEALATLPKAAGTPAELIVGEDEEGSSLLLKANHQVPEDPARFLPPPKYQQDPLSALEGIE